MDVTYSALVIGNSDMPGCQRTNDSSPQTIFCTDPEEEKKIVLIVLNNFDLFSN